MQTAFCTQAMLGQSDWVQALWRQIVFVLGGDLFVEGLARRRVSKSIDVNIVTFMILELAMLIGSAVRLWLPGTHAGRPI